MALLQWLYQFTFPQTAQEGSLFSTHYPAFVICRLFNDGHSDWCEVVPHCSFDLRFSKINDVEASLIAQLVKNPPAMQETLV